MVTMANIKPTTPIRSPESGFQNSRSESSNSQQKVSYRTETLIHETARSALSQAYASTESPRPQSRVSHTSHRSQNSAHSQAGSSQQESDIFSEHSPRSSLGSTGDDSHESVTNAPSNYASSTQDGDDTITNKTSRISRISNIAYEEFMSSDSRCHSRAAFLPMSSPEPSILNGSTTSPRGLRHKVCSSASAQYSPRNKSTPPRFKRKDMPLVLLHVTLMPLRWQWADLITTSDVADMTEECKNLRDSWRLLQDHVGDTLLERGILLPHPQDDYEVLEERLLDALELPGKRRARILECGHYIGYSNMMGDSDEDSGDEFDRIHDDDNENDDDGEEEDAELSSRYRWCPTCREDIKFDTLGDSKIFKIKVFASNGLISPGAWQACWKEMERVDVELEPLVDSTLQDELEQLAIMRDQRHQDEMEAAHSYLHGSGHTVEPENELIKEHLRNEPPAEHPSLLSSPIPPMSSPGLAPSPTPNTRRRLDEERLREVYGHTPPVSSPADHLSRLNSPTPSHSGRPRSQRFGAGSDLGVQPESIPKFTKTPPDGFSPMEFPSSPSTQAFERKELRQSQQRVFLDEQSHHGHELSKDASLAQLMLQAIRVTVQDRRNIAIVFLSVLVVLFAIKSPVAPKLSEQDIQTIIERSNARMLEMDRAQIPTIEVEARAEPTTDFETMTMANTMKNVVLDNDIFPGPVVDMGNHDTNVRSAETWQAEKMNEPVPSMMSSGSSDKPFVESANTAVETMLQTLNKEAESQTETALFDTFEQLQAEGDGNKNELESMESSIQDFIIDPDVAIVHADQTGTSPALIFSLFKTVTSTSTRVETVTSTDVAYETITATDTVTKTEKVTETVKISMTESLVPNVKEVAISEVGGQPEGVKPIARQDMFGPVDIVLLGNELELVIPEKSAIEEALAINAANTPNEMSQTEIIFSEDWPNESARELIDPNSKDLQPRQL